MKKTLPLSLSFLFLPLCTHAQSVVEQLAGNWQLVAANNGVYVAPVWKSTTDYIDFIATAGSDGTSLDCHTDCLYDRSGTTYPADWKLVVEENTEGKHRIGLVLDDSKPASTKEFQETRDKYADQGSWYWGGSDGGHRYIYLLSDKVGEDGLYGMTFWSEWSSAGTTTYSLSNTEYQARQIYAVVCESQPYSESSKVGYFEIWASPKIQKTTSTSITTIPSSTSSLTGRDGLLYNLAGQRVSNSYKGVVIQNGKKYMIR